MSETIKILCQSFLSLAFRFADMFLFCFMLITIGLHCKDTKNIDYLVTYTLKYMAKEIKFNIKLLIDGKEQLGIATTDVGKLRQVMEETKTTAQQFRDKLLTINQTVTALQNASSAINGLRDTMAGLTASYNAVQQANTQLTTVMRQRMDATDEDIKKVNEVIGAQSKLGVIGGTIQKTGAQQIATFLKEKGTLEQLIPAMNDLLAQQKGLNVSQEDARSVANLMGKAMTGQTSALRRVGITFNEAQENIMKYGTEQQRAAMLAQIITDNVGHMNAQLGKTDAGQLKQAEMQFAAIKVQIGELVSKWLPKISFAAQALSIVNSMISLGNSIKGVTVIIKNFNITTKAVSAICIAARASVVGLSAVTRVMQAAFTGATIGATTLKIAIKSLLISTGVGVAIVALAEVIAAFTSKSSDAQTQAEDTAESMKGIGDAADDIKTAYDSALKNTYADLMAKYEKLKAGWRALSTEQQKMAWIKDNQSAFNELRLKIGNVTEAENIFNRKTDAVVEAFKQRALAAAYAAKLTALYQRQIELLDKKQKITKTIADDAKQGGRHAKEGDIVPESWRSDRYGKVGSDGQWRFTKVGAERYNGTNVSGNTQINSVDKELNNVDREIAATQKQLTERLKSANSFITADKPTAPKTTPGKHDTTTEPKTHLEDLQAQLSAAQKEKGNAMTVEARVKADAKIQDIQAQIDEATKGKVSIEAETEPSYIVQGSDADKRQSHNNAGQHINRIRQDFEIGLIGKEDAERQIADINKQLEKLGIKPIEVHFKTYIKELQEQLHDAQREFDEATTIEAKVKADAKIDEIQAQIDEATKGKVSIEAEAEPSYIVKGSKADKRQSYANAQSKANSVQSDYEAGIINKEEALKSIDDINAELEKLNLTPVKIDVETEDIDKAKEKMSGACDAIKAMGSSLSGLGDAIEVPELNVAGTMAQAIATMVDGYATATAQAGKLGPWAWVAFAATGLATLTAMIASVKQAGAFATGGIVGGTSSSGDKKFARVNSGEMILNKFQQTRLFNMVNGNFQPPTFTAGEMQPVTMNNISNNIEPSTTIVNVHLDANARKMLKELSNTKKVTGKSGRVYNV